MRVIVLLGMLVAAAMLPPLAFSAFLLDRSNRSQHDAVLVLAEATTGAAVETIDRQLAGMRTTLRGLASSDLLESNNLRPIYDSAIATLQGTQSYLLVTDSTTQVLLNTRQPFGEPQGMMSDPGPVQLALGTGETVVTDGFRGAVSRKWVFNVILPWRPEGQKPFALILTQDAESLSSLLSTENLRGGWNAVILDSKGIVLASSLMQSDIGKPFFLGEAARGGGPTRRTATVDGASYDFVTKVSPSSGWNVVLWARSSVIQQNMTRTFRTLVIGGLGMAMAGLLVAWSFGRQIAASVRTLAKDARRLGSGEDVPARRFPVKELSTVSLALAEASQARRDAVNEIRFLMREVAHRSKNQLTVVSSLVRQSARNTTDVKELSESFQSRVMGLARSTDLLIAGSVAGVELAALLKAQIEPFKPGDAASLTISGPPYRLSAQSAQTLGLAIHELATNAAKYGSLAEDQGRLSVTWRLAGDHLVLTWREIGAQLVEPPDVTGFGTQLIERTLVGALRAEVEYAYHSDGLEFVARIPMATLPKDEAASR